MTMLRSRSFIQSIGVLLVALTFMSLTNSTYFETQFSMMERGLACLGVSLLYKQVHSPTTRIVVPVFNIGLLAAAFISIANYLQATFVEDLIGYFAAFMSAAVYVSIFNFKFLIQAVSAGFGLIILWCYAILVSGSSGWNEYGQFQGPFVHYNFLGFAMLLSIPTFLVLDFKNKLLTFVSRFVLVIGSFYLLLISESRTALVIALATILVYLILKTFTFSQKAGWFLLSLSIFSFVTLMSNLTQFLELLGKDQTLTGRTQIWSNLAGQLLNKPFTGFGWARLFPPGSPISEIASTEMGFTVHHSHSDFLHWYISTGLLGLIMLFLSFAAIIWVAVKAVLGRNTQQGIWILLSSLTLIGAGITEISTFQIQGWLLFSFLSVSAMSLKGDSKQVKNLFSFRI